MDLRSILERQGFDPELWMDYAESHGFRRESAVRLVACPECNGVNKRVVGQFVYYSHLVKLLGCECGLYYTDVRFDGTVTDRHFDVAYKDEEYFSSRRS